QGFELRAELPGRRSAVGTRVERRVFKCRYHARNLGLQVGDLRLRRLELAPRSTQVLTWVAFWSRGDAPSLVYPPQRLVFGGADGRRMRALRADFLPFREAPRELGHVPVVQDPDARRQRPEQR